MAWQPSSRDWADAWTSMNPWHSEGRVPAALAKPRRRPLAEALWRTLATPIVDRFQLVIGPRRVGKTVAMYQTIEQLLANGVSPRRLWWLHLAHPLLVQSNLGGLVQEVLEAAAASDADPAFLFLDELAYADQWDVWLKTFYDERWPLRIIATSSATAALREGRLESGVGRWEEQYLAPCLFTEYLHLRGRDVRLEPAESLRAALQAAPPSYAASEEIAQERQRFVLVGGFPELLIPDRSARDPSSETSLSDEVYVSQRILRDDAVQKAIYQDIPQVFGMTSPMNLERLLYTLAGQVAGLVSPTGLATNVGLSAPTLETYITYLERSFLVFLLNNYAPKEETVQRRGRKLYFVDGAVRNAALQRGTAPLRDPGEMGLLLENAVASHLHALSRHSGLRLYHWRDGRYEVDLIHDHPEHPVAIEVGSSANHTTSGLNQLQRRHPRFQGACYLTYPSAPVVTAGPGDQIGRIPLDLLLIIIGTQAEHELKRRLGF